MGTKFIDLTGQKFGRLTVINRVHGGHEVKWRCICECGGGAVTRGYALRSGKAQSCGCRAREIAKAQFTTHGMIKTSEYNIWGAMLERCNNPNNVHFKHYGGRGIYVSSDWHKFENFYKDMGQRPAGLSIERKDNNGPYSKENCIWADKATQSRNKRGLRFIEFNGQSKILTDWAKDVGIHATALGGRLKSGWSIERALTEPPHKENIRYGR